jgi:hypothetical protein
VCLCAWRARSCAGGALVWTRLAARAPASQPLRYGRDAFRSVALPSRVSMTRPGALPFHVLQSLRLSFGMLHVTRHPLPSPAAMCNAAFVSSSHAQTKRRSAAYEAMAISSSAAGELPLSSEALPGRWPRSG